LNILLHLQNKGWYEEFEDELKAEFGEGIEKFKGKNYLHVVSIA